MNQQHFEFVRAPRMRGAGVQLRVLQGGGKRGQAMNGLMSQRTSALAQNILQIGVRCYGAWRVFMHKEGRAEV